MSNTNQNSTPDFDHLTPDTVLELVEACMDIRCSNICRPLNSYINRVYEVHRDDGEPLIAKFYRPSRWSEPALRDEHTFLTELAEDEIPVIAPLRTPQGETLHQSDNLFFALFPKKGGRICDEPTDEQWLELGRLLARVHVVGASRESTHRIHMSPEGCTQEQLEYILDSGVIPQESFNAYEDAAEETLDRIFPLFEGQPFIRIHGDCHHQNIIFRPGESFYMIDFDDMAMGLPVQDLWMLLPGRLEDTRQEVSLFLEGYEMFRPFEVSSLRLIEPLRAMRYIHFTAWCVRQAEDGGFTRLAPDWGTASYWNREANELNKQQTEIQDAQEASLHI